MRGVKRHRMSRVILWQGHCDNYKLPVRFSAWHLPNCTCSWPVRVTLEEQVHRQRLSCGIMYLVILRGSIAPIFGNMYVRIESCVLYGAYQVLYALYVYLLRLNTFLWNHASTIRCNNRRIYSLERVLDFIWNVSAVNQSDLTASTNQIVEL